VTTDPSGGELMRAIESLRYEFNRFRDHVDTRFDQVVASAVHDRDYANHEKRLSDLEDEARTSRRQRSAWGFAFLLTAVASATSILVALTQ
jgi:hypothetical protein